MKHFDRVLIDTQNNMDGEHKNRKAESLMSSSHPHRDSQKPNNSDPGNSKENNCAQQNEHDTPPRAPIRNTKHSAKKSIGGKCFKRGQPKQKNGAKLDIKSGAVKTESKNKKNNKKKNKKKGGTFVHYVRKSSIERRKQAKKSDKKKSIRKLEQQMRDTFFEEDNTLNTNGNGKARSRSLSSGRSSNRSSRSDDGIYGKARSLIPKTRQNIVDEMEDYLLNKKKFYNLKFEKKLEMIKNSSKKIAREFYKIDYTYKFLSAISRKFKSEPKLIEKFNVPLKINDKGEAELTNSYYVLLNSIDYFQLCRYCQINSFDATKDTKKVVSHKISLMVKKMRVNEESLGKEGYEENLKFNLRGNSPSLFIDRRNEFFNPMHVFRRR